MADTNFLHLFPSLSSSSVAPMSFKSLDTQSSYLSFGRSSSIFPGGFISRVYPESLIFTCPYITGDLLYTTLMFVTSSLFSDVITSYMVFPHMSISYPHVHLHIFITVVSNFLTMPTGHTQCPCSVKHSWLYQYCAMIIDHSFDSLWYSVGT